MFKRTWNIGGAALVVAIMAGLIAWSPSLWSSQSEVTNAAQRGRPNDFTLPTLEGGTWSLASHRGQVVLVNFWATWCPPCRMETPDLVALQSDYASRGFQIVGINMDDDPAGVPGFVKQYRINYPVLLPRAAFALAANVDALPTSILLDRNGRVARRYLGFIDPKAIRSDIDALLQERKAH